MTSGLFVIVAKLTSKHSISNPWLFNFLLTAVTLLFTIPPAIYYHAVMPSNWLLIILAAVFATLFNIFYIYSNNSLDVSVYMPLFNFRGIFAVLIGAVFFGEKIFASSLIYIILIIIAGIFSSMDEKFNVKSFLRNVIFVGILSTLFLAIFNAFTKQVMIGDSLWTTNLWIAIINFILVIPTIALFNKELKTLDFAHILPVGAMGLLSTITSFASNTAYSLNLSISSLIMNIPFSMIFAFIFSIFAPRLLEKHTLKIYVIRFSSVAVMIWAAIQLTG